MRKPLAVTLFVFSLCSAVLATEAGLEKQLTDRYKGHVLALRHPFVSRQQEYGADGEPVGPAPEGPWTLYGRIRIDKIVADGNALHVKGTRALCEFTNQGLKLIHEKEKVAITVLSNRPLSSEGEAIAVLGRVFTLTPEEIVSSAPDFWRDYLNKQMLGGPGPGWSAIANPPKDLPASDPRTATDAREVVPQVFHLGEKNVTAPKPQYTPEPRFTEAARNEHYRGVVGLNIIVDAEGRVEKARIVHALGLGLDESAVETVRTWKFAPATREGKPVSVSLYVEVDFHWY